ncbi:hypothetical protein [Thermobifida halotolerans]|nr:hypothetical protein [Thermobifida halotolerans]
MLLCLTSAKGSPGVTTTALALTLTWPRPVLLVEADPAGGDLRSGFLQGADTAHRNLLEVAHTVRHGLDAADIAARCLALDPPERTRLVLPGLPGPFHGAGLRALWPRFLDALAHLKVRDPVWPAPVDVVVDCGRMDHPHMPWRLVEAADVVAVVVRTTLRSVLAAQPHVEHLRATLGQVTGRPAALVAAAITEGSYSVGELRAVGVDVAATLPHDPVAARVLSERAGRRGLSARSQFLRGARTAAAALRERAARTGHATGPAPGGVAAGEVARVHGL